MKPFKRKFAAPLALFILLAAAQLASAFYDPSLGRWINRDPITENGFRMLSKPQSFSRSGELNLYAFVKNQPIGELDPLGLKIWVCSRKVQGFPFVGNHGYLWDDTGKNAPCGKRGSSCFRQNPNDSNNDKGPGEDDCTPVDGSDGKEDDVMQCCQEKANGGVWLPGLNDCHNLVNRCLKKSGLTPPPHPRFGTLDQSCPTE